MRPQSSKFTQWGGTGVLLIALLVTGCATKIHEAKPVVEAPAFREVVSKTVGVYYSPELRNYEWAMALGVDVFPVGRESVSMFQELFATLFEDTQEVEGTNLSPNDHPEIAAIIAPRIEAFEYYYDPWEDPFDNKSFFAEITYRFTLYERDGSLVDDWTAHGRGRQAQGERIGGNVKMAMEEAAEEFLHEFHRVAERHWGTETFEYSAAFAEVRIAGPNGVTGGFGPAAVAGLFEGTLTVVVDPYVEADRQSAEFPGVDLRRSGVVPIRVHATSDGPGTLEIRRSRIVARQAQGSEVAQLDDDELRALLTPFHGRFFITGGIFALPLVFANAARMQAEVEAGSRSMAIMDAGTIEVARLAQGEIADGFVYFHRSAFDGPIHDATLIVPVADVEAKKVYSVEIPLRGPAQVFTPYRVN